MAAAQRLRVAAIQMVSGDNVSENLKQARRLMEDACRDGAELLVLPENFGFMGETDELIRAVAEQDHDGPMQNFLRDEARRLGVLVVGGTLPIRHDASGKAFSACLVHSAEGECLGRYDKMHLFDVRVPGSEDESYLESAHMVPGQEPVVVDTPVGRLGLAICYDLRFPELFRLMVDRGAEIIALPAAFTLSTGRLHWQTLIKARAIENLVYMVASDQGGRHVSGWETYGHSMVVDPWGELIALHGYGAGVCLADVDRAYLADVRTRFPVLDHRRLSVKTLA